ncbi:S-layer homology domain-containing protein [Bacillus solimangrovi]|uniref:S-layer homology domain-containing protein n=1 Tax=Bacillus solimangrovi TaxID=1305675 RepID=UPI001586A8FF|nr:S-layer homology domain-containing protein [Bacillus solimangrovi]
MSVILTSSLLVLSMFTTGTAFASPFSSVVSENETKVSPGVTWKSTVYEGEGDIEKVHMLDVNLDDPNTTLEVGIPNPFDSLEIVTEQAKQNSLEGHHVVGAVNAGFFDPKTRLPISLFIKDNQIYNFGLYELDANSPTNASVAFGIDKDGSAQIDQFEHTIRIESDDVDVTTNRINETRNEGELVVFTKPYKRSWANEWGTEFILSDVTPSMDEIEAGEPVTGTVSKLTRVGEYPGSEVPEDGFIISAHGQEWAEKLAALDNGDEVTITFDFNRTWEDAEYVLGTGPLLVDEGKVSISMNQATSFAKSLHPRTAIAVDKSGDRVFVVTVDGRQPGYSDGSSLIDLAEYLIEQGAYRAINLDGGGSTAIAVRELGQFLPSLQNSPSDGSQRSVSTTLLAVSNTNTGQAKTMKLSKEEGKVFVGTKVPIDVTYALDQYLNPVTVKTEDVEWDSNNDAIGEMEGNTFVANAAGQTTVSANFEDSLGQIAVTVVDKFKELQIAPNSLKIGTEQSTTFKATPLTDDGSPIIFDESLIKWATKGNIGTITDGGTFTAAEQPAEGEIVVTVGAMEVTVPVEVGADPEVVEEFETLDNWTESSARSVTELSLSGVPSPVYEGSKSLRLKYDFTTDEQGIKASYAVANQKVQIPGKPVELGLWVYGDGNKHWLRGKLIDGVGNEHTIDFTEEAGLDWKGWNYVRASIPNDLPLPLSIKRIYVAETLPEKQDKGVLYFDKLQAVYNTDHEEPRFKDMTSEHWAFGAVLSLTNDNIITGFPDATFRPQDNLTRAQAAIMIARELQLPLADRPNPGFEDIDNSHYAYEAVAAVADEGIIQGMSAEQFAPDKPLTRAQMAAILKRAYKLEGTDGKAFKDVQATHWASKDIKTLSANNITSGYPDGTYGPEKATTRAEFASFLTRVIK